MKPQQSSLRGALSRLDLSVANLGGDRSDIGHTEPGLRLGSPAKRREMGQIRTWTPSKLHENLVTGAGRTWVQSTNTPLRNLYGYTPPTTPPSVYLLLAVKLAYLSLLGMPNTPSI